MLMLPEEFLGGDHSSSIFSRAIGLSNLEALRRQTGNLLVGDYRGQAMPVVELSLPTCPSGSGSSNYLSYLEKSKQSLTRGARVAGTEAYRRS
ncbi:uncharacterized protein M6B38_268400 [Iris pallida]|uniref:Uncharacterized protein n=1 Tax=Iris pallida TaxID=29817 RepID=A0AAX6IAI4_IRIPA|nr:uncharacterized protein M6B38_310255 [Iris pallida]KAJ6850021.1 uncharacterized protein M6B38_268400 [Iris pallida]